MMRSKFFTLLILMCLGYGKLFAQNSQFTVWGAWFHTQKLSEHWGYAFDGQLRSADKVDYLRNILLRPSVAYYFNKNQFANLGYTYVTTYGRTLDGEKTFRPESRIFEQFTQGHKISKSVQVSHRFRLEQRYLGDSADDRDDNYFAQRFRYFIRAVIPMQRDSNFSKGTFIALQNEVFLNVQNKDKVNTHFFDQNRAYVAFGYRFSKKFDMEVGYLNQYTKAASSGTSNNVVQMVFYTRL
ncbi:DUF2490 domain-containing protein [Mucilaginibacter sp. UR6-1]|uniref:DUF2490 domain-containing protein n=1 Tax=Mucilaginibacter sp. UR6-1 TaxID=1435643 RepID=UPI001E606B77|nr:DUF2490 domain-containing protein [Mucilaginibacter sp. UR6-1]MCC8410953.1 DUF2490 domain-containing protein [Mucilaginibacter sp. UR6-1]